MTKRLEGCVALVVGGARGIGQAVAERFREEGASLAVADTETEAGAAAAKAMSAHFVEADISQPAHAARMVEETVDRYGRIDILVQNAGIYPWTLIENMSPEEWDAVTAVNLKGAFLAARSALPHMKAQGNGRLLFTSSITGNHVTSPGHGHYSATKAGINGFIKAAALEFSGYGITVNGVEPGNILTEGMKTHRSADFIQSMADAIPLGRLGTPRDVANAFLFLASDEAAFITGTTIVVDGGQLLPEGNDFRLNPHD